MHVQATVATAARRVVVSVLGLAFLATALEASTITFGSGSSWNTYSDAALTTSLGPAQAVCLNAAAPAPCPAGAVVYGYPGGGWPANLAAIPGAQWIWAPGVTGSTEPAEFAQYYFSSSFPVGGPVTAAAFYLAADDFAQLLVNGTSVGTVGSITDIGLAGAAQSALTLFDISPYLVLGSNVITVNAQNGPPAYSGCGAPCGYAEQPAATVFGGSIEFADAAAVPEPSALLSLGLGLGAVFGLVRRRRAA